MHFYTFRPPAPTVRTGIGRVGGSGPRGWPGGHVPRLVLRPPAARVVASRAMGTGARSAGCLRADYRPQSPVSSPLPPMWAVGVFFCTQVKWSA